MHSYKQKRLKIRSIIIEVNNHYTNTSVLEYKSFFNQHACHSGLLRRFYHSRNRKKSEEIQTPRFLNTLVNRERRRIVGDKGDFTEKKNEV